jgi:uncharacterized protein (DUF1697 family)
MPELRELLSGAGFGQVQTYVQSGNVVLSSELEPEALEREIERLIEERFGLTIAVVARTRDELADVVERDPLGDIVDNPKRYQVSFLTSPLAPEVIEKIHATAVEPERVVVDSREVFAWHPGGVGPSKLWALLASPRIGATATARNWTTVTTLLEMADE